jgi:hypothetical protein
MEKVGLRVLVKACPKLSEYERSLLFQIDVEVKSVSQVARELGKAKSTISSQHTKALQKLEVWLKQSKEKTGEEDFDASVFQRLNAGYTPNKIIAIVGRPERVMKLAEMWKEINRSGYWEAIELMRDFGAITDLPEEGEDPLYTWACALCDRVNKAESEKEEAEKKLAEYEKKIGTVRELNAEEEKIRDKVGSLIKSEVELEKKIATLERKEKGLVEEQAAAERKIDELSKQTEKIAMTRDTLQIQLAALQTRLSYYRTKHGRNIKEGDLIKRKDSSILYLVLGEAEDKKSWKIGLFESEQLAAVIDKYEVSKEHVKGFVPKEEVIENWEIVDVNEGLSKI